MIGANKSKAKVHYEHCLKEPFIRGKAENVR